MIVKLTIDGKPVEAEAGTSVLEVAATMGIQIPTLCHLPGKDPLTSCMVCLVRVNGQAKLSPACATKVTEGMTIASETPEIRKARQTAIELLLSEHAGDCLAPCQLVCPAHMEIDKMLWHIGRGEFRQAAEVVKEHIPLPATLGRVCPELCEKGCRREQHDKAVSICQLKRFVGDTDLASDTPFVPTLKAASGKRVAIVGTGPAGLSAAYYLLTLGHAVVLHDAAAEAGGALRTAVSPEILPRKVLDAEIDALRKMGAEFRMGVKLGEAGTAGGETVTLGGLTGAFDAVLLACGPIDLAAARTLGLATAAKGVKVDPATMMTSVDRVFATGAMVTPYKLSVRAVGDGHLAAKTIDAYLRGEKKPAAHEFSVRLGTLTEAEMAVYLADAGADDRIPKLAIPGPGLTVEQAIIESRRCLQCGCIKAKTCSLRVLATEHGANATRFRGDRRVVERCNSHPEIVYEPGKCISCGRCVAIAAEAGEEFGLTQIKRGFGVRIEPGLGVTLESALAKSAARVVAACPTAALAWKRDCASCGAGCGAAEAAGGGVTKATAGA